MQDFNRLVVRAVHFTILLLGHSIACPAGEPEILHLKNGDELTGHSRDIQDGLLYWQFSADGPQLQFPIDVIDRIEMPPTESPSTEPEIEIAPHAENGVDKNRRDKLENSGEQPLEAGFLQRTRRLFHAACGRACHDAELWTDRIEIGGSFLDGNSEQDNFNFGAHLEKETPQRLYQIDIGGEYAESDGVPSANRWFGNTTVDFSKKGWLIFFIGTRNEFDEFENLDYRGSYSTGLGVRFFNDERRRLIFRLGPGLTYERFRDPFRTRTTPDLFAELQGRYRVNRRATLEHKTTITPSVNDLQVFRSTSNNSVLLRIDEEGRWKIKLGLRLDHNSRPNPGRLSDDYTTTVSIVYKRK